MSEGFGILGRRGRGPAELAAIDRAARRLSRLALYPRPSLELSVQPGDALLESGDTLERGVPAGLQLARDVPLGRVDVVVAALGK